MLPVSRHLGLLTISTLPWTTLAQLYHIQEHQRRIREHCNSITTTYRLSDEIIVETFKLCAPSPETFDLHQTLILAFSHVSHHWRHLALQHPFLWTQLERRLPRLVDAMLKRLKDVPFSLDGCLSPQVSAQQVALKAWLPRSFESGPDSGAHIANQGGRFLIYYWPVLCTFL